MGGGQILQIALLLFQSADLLRETGLAALSRLDSLNVNLPVGLQTNATARNGRCRKDTLGVTAMDDHTACLADHLGDIAHDMLLSVAARVFGDLTDARCPQFHLSAIGGGLQSQLCTPQDNGGSAIEQHAIVIDVADDNLGGGDDEPLVIPQIASFHKAVVEIIGYPLYLGLAFPDL